MVLKISIIGGGIGGLAAYRALRKYVAPELASSADASSHIAINLYEAYPTPASTTQKIGGGLGLAPNGMHALSLIHPPAVSYIFEHGYETEKFVALNANGTTVGAMRFGRRSGYGMTMAARATIHESLLIDLENIPNEYEVHWGKKVTSIRDEETGVILSFEDGTEETCDILIAADGVHSVARKAIFGTDAYLPKYE
jgi:2-polyprenyl-6-methoxyphenol hydroxylase-like FAD-dependent oxidoreductase